MFLQAHQIARRPYLQENASKANFTSVYNRVTPHEYFRAMQAVDYQVADRARPIYRLILSHLDRTTISRPSRVVDVGCSYGVLSALLKYDVSFRDLAKHYAGDVHSPDAKSSRARDLSFFDTKRIQLPLEMVGIDIADRAVSYALETKLIAQGFAIDFERGQSFQRGKLTDVDLVISTGCIGYVGAEGVNNLLNATSGKQPWIACFVMRMFPFQPIADVLVRHGYRTFHLANISVPQRRFVSDAEASAAISRVKSLGLATARKEERGYYFTDLFVALPEGEEKDLITTLEAVVPSFSLSGGRGLQ